MPRCLNDGIYSTISCSGQESGHELLLNMIDAKKPSWISSKGLLNVKFDDERILHQAKAVAYLCIGSYVTNLGKH